MMNFENPYKLDLIEDPIEELYLWEHLLSSEESKHRVTLDLISLAIVSRQALGDTITCYSEETEHALHPEGFTWADSSSPVIPLQRQPNQVATPVEGVA